MSADRIRIVLDKSVDELAYAPLVVRNNWMNQRRIPRRGDQNSEWVYSTEDRVSWIHYVDDHTLGVKYMLVISPEASKHEAIIRKGVVNWPTQMTRDRARKAQLSRKDRCEVLSHLAVDTVEKAFDQEVFDFYSAALRDPDAAVRRAAVIGASYLGWSQLAEPLRPLATDTEKNEAVRRDAAVLLRRFAEGSL